MAGEDAVRVLGGELAPGVGVSRLDDDRAALRRARQREAPLDVDLLARVAKRTRVGPGDEHAARGVRDEVLRPPGVPQPGGRLQQLAPADVAVVVRRESRRG